MGALHLADRGEPPRTIASYERELAQCRRTENDLREALAREDILPREKDGLLLRHEELSKEADHRLLNSVQTIVSLLSLQSQGAANAEAVAQLAIAANRVATIGRVHRRLHSCDGVDAVAFKQYVEDLCQDFSAMLWSDKDPEHVIAVEGSEIDLPTASAIPLGFIVNELVTNAAKHGNGRITVRLEPKSDKGYALSVSNEGPPLPEGFDPAAGKGLGMTIVRSFVQRIDGELQVGRGDNGQGAKFTVLFP